MNRKNNWSEFKEIADRNGIKKLYHFTDRENLESIIKNGGLYSWGDCEKKGIVIPKPGGDSLSRELDSRDSLQEYVRLSITPSHPMMHIAMKRDQGGITNPVILEVDLEPLYWEDTLYSDCNATKNGANIGKGIDDFKRIHFETAKMSNYFAVDEEEKPYYQAEVLVHHFIPLENITNISNFGISIPNSAQMQIKEPYTAQITRMTPTAFIFLVDHSVSMTSLTEMNGEKMAMSEAVAQIVNNQINELVLRCIKTNEIRHYFDIAVIGYGEEAYSGWQGDLEGRGFVSPKELYEHPFSREKVQEKKRTRRGMVMKEVEKVEWISPRANGAWTKVHHALNMAKDMLEEWMLEHKEHDCYPPTIINITDGAFNGESRDNLIQLANEIKAMFTNDGNVLLWNIHITSGNADPMLLPVSKEELGGNSYSNQLFDMSSHLPLRYNQAISRVRGDEADVRHIAMSTNSDMSTLIQLMDIGTPTNIRQTV